MNIMLCIYPLYVKRATSPLITHYARKWHTTQSIKDRRVQFGDVRPSRTYNVQQFVDTRWKYAVLLCEM